MIAQIKKQDIINLTKILIILWPDLLLSHIRLPRSRFEGKDLNNIGVLYEVLAIFGKVIRFYGPLQKGANHEKRCHIHLFR
ncbi:hypothetical protein JNUCC23_16755 [Peribacillus sp. JNUCC 23]